MKKHKLTAGGQVSIPADVRRRWGTTSVSIDDRGDSIVIRPVPDDPIAAARGVLQGRLPPTEELRRIARAEEVAAGRRRT